MFQLLLSQLVDAAFFQLNKANVYLLALVYNILFLRYSNFKCVQDFMEVLLIISNIYRTVLLNLHKSTVFPKVFMIVE